MPHSRTLSEKDASPRGPWGSLGTSSGPDTFTLLNKGSSTETIDLSTGVSFSGPGTDDYVVILGVGLSGHRGWPVVLIQALLIVGIVVTSVLDLTDLRHKKGEGPEATSYPAHSSADEVSPHVRTRIRVAGLWKGAAWRTTLVGISRRLWDARTWPS